MRLEPDCWLHPDVEVRDSPIAGLGLFARVPLAAGVVVSRLGGDIVTTTQLRALFARAAAKGGYVNAITLGDDRHLTYPADSPNGRGNHSCDPTTWWNDAVTLTTRHPIAAGEELTSDYATSTDDESFSMTCRCGAAGCRGVVTGRDWQRAGLRERYGPHWVPALLARIAAD